MKNINWKTLILAVITAILGNIGINQTGVLDSEVSAPQSVAMAASPGYTDFSDLATDNGNCQTSRFCAIYEVAAWWNQPVKIGGNSLAEYSFDVKTSFVKSVVISDNYTNEKAITALQKQPPYTGWKVDKVISKRFIQYIKYPSSGGEKPEPLPEEPPITE